MQYIFLGAFVGLILYEIMRHALRRAYVRGALDALKRMKTIIEAKEVVREHEE